MRTALILSAFALVTFLGAQAPASPRATQHEHASCGLATDPDPADCPFCGGNPALHVARVFEIERLTLTLSTGMLR